MTSKKKKAKSKALKSAPSSKKPAGKKKASTVREKKSLKEKSNAISYYIESVSRKKPLKYEIVKTEKFKVRNRSFEILLLKDMKRKKLLFRAAELIAGARSGQLNSMEINMPDQNAPAEKVPGYKDILAAMKSTIRDYTDNATDNIKKFLWSQFGASIDMLNNAIRSWPVDAWETDRRFFYNAYHALVFLDYYLTDPGVKFRSMLPFTLTEKHVAPAEAIDDVIPDRVYTRQELLDYGEVLKQKCRSVIRGLNEDRLGDRWIEKDGNMNYSWLEILLYNMRHVQHHSAQLNMLLRQKVNTAPGWVARERTGL